MMTIEAGGFMQQIRRSNAVVNNNNKVIKKKNRCRKKVRIQLKRRDSFTLQRLFESCQHVFKGSGTVPSPHDVQKLCEILDDMKPEDVGLKEDLQFFKLKAEIEGTTPRVTSATIHKSENFELCIFFLPANAVIPLHNHPEMTVFSKLLLGTMHIKAYDWVDPQDSNYSTSPPKSRLAKLKVNAAFTPTSGASVLYPTSGGNIHEFTAITPCAVLDVIGPPYIKDDGSYYKDTPYGNLSPVSGEGVMEKVNEDDGGCYAWLEEIEHPEESEMDAIEYMGPQIIYPNS